MNQHVQGEDFATRYQVRPKVLFLLLYLMCSDHVHCVNNPEDIVLDVIRNLTFKLR